MRNDAPGRPRVLIVEGNEAVRGVLARFLEDSGYDVRPAEDAEMALMIAQVDDELEYAVVNLELGLDGSEGGVEAAMLVARQRPNIKIVMLSPYERDHQIPSKLEQDVPQAVGYVWTLSGNLNYVDGVRIELERLAALRTKRKCFVIMPFSATRSVTEEVWNDIFLNGIKPGIESNGVYECSRSNPWVGNVISQIFDSLNSADVVVADLTDRNANVFYELGVRHALRDCTILMAQKMQDVPSDLTGNATVIYRWDTEEGRAKLRGALESAIGSIDAAIAMGRREIVVSPVRAYMIPAKAGSTGKVA